MLPNTGFRKSHAADMIALGKTIPAQAAQLARAAAEAAAEADAARQDVQDRDDKLTAEHQPQEGAQP